MKKTLGIIASLLFLSTASFMMTGCADRGCCDYTPVCCDPCGEEPPCECLPKCKHSNTAEYCCLDGITVRAMNPRMCMLGEEYPLEFCIEACKDVCDVVVKTTLPDGVEYKRSSPEAEVNGKTLTWNIGSMKCGESIPGKIWVKCNCEGEQCACFCATATPVRFCSLLCAHPSLRCQKCGPEEVCLGDEVNYRITVTNRGSCAAEDVVVTDNVPAGLEHRSGMKQLVYKLGSLKPCECREVNVSLCAAERGTFCNTAVVTSCNADTVSCHQSTRVIQMGIDITKTGPKEMQLGKNADYQITVTNTGDKSFHNVVVTDHAPRATSIVAANGATICENEAVWRLKELKAGESQNFTITLTTCTTGCHTNRVGVQTCEGCSDCAEFTTRWIGRPALNMCISETEDMLCIGDGTRYVITVTNQGSEPDDNVKLVLRFPDAIKPTEIISGSNGVIDGQTVTFGPLNNFGARQTMTFRVDATAQASGDARVIAELTSDAFRTPIISQESTVIN